MKHFEEVFPEIYQSNDVGKIGKETFKLWNESSNNMEPCTLSLLEHVVGRVGPSVSVNLLKAGPSM